MLPYLVDNTRNGLLLREGASIHGSGWRVTFTGAYRTDRRWEAFWAGSKPPSGIDEDLVPFSCLLAALAWLNRKGASKHTLRATALASGWCIASRRQKPTVSPSRPNTSRNGSH